MSLQDGLIEELRGRLPEYLRMTGRLRGRGKMRCINPGHVDKEPSMGYDSKKKRVHCFGCGKSYDLFDVIGLDYPDCAMFSQQVRKACEVFGLIAPQALSRTSKAVVRPLGKGRDFTAFVEEEMKRTGAGGDYFAQRGISKALCEKYRLFQKGGYAYLPIWHKGRCVAYCARSMKDSGPRYKNSPGPMALFGEDLLEGNGIGDLVVTESIFDALAAEECGVMAVALCGAGNTARFLKCCAQNPGLANRRFLLAGDMDETGRRMNRELEEGLKALGLSFVSVRLPGSVKDLNEALRTDRKGLERALLEAGVNYGAERASALLGAFRGLTDEIRHVSVPTGLSGVDKMLGGGLFPGLYVLGAVSSLGKTSFALQIADAIAESGRDVLYFTLEMSAFELISKSLSRMTSQMDTTVSRAKALTMRQVLCAGNSPLLARAVDQYAAGPGERLFFSEAPAGTTEIRQTVLSHCRVRGEAPVVIVDYLQILRPADGRATDKQNTDRAVVDLKRLSREYRIPVLAISSFNRENYRNPVSMESFKESGAVEYSSDILLGMQLAGAGSPRFDMNAAKLRSPRALELVMLKNRAGTPYAVLPLRYFAQFSLFVE